ncbi:MAG: Mobile element protein, partial [Olavius algarvensis Gamma 1 endosymbiont]
GAIDLDRLEPVVRFDPTIDSDSTLALFAQLEAANPNATAIYIICDNAPYYRSRAVQDYLKTSCIQ